MLKKDLSMFINDVFSACLSRELNAFFCFSVFRLKTTDDFLEILCNSLVMYYSCRCLSFVHRNVRMLDFRSTHREWERRNKSDLFSRLTFDIIANFWIHEYKQCSFLVSILVSCLLCLVFWKVLPSFQRSKFTSNLSSSK